MRTLLLFALILTTIWTHGHANGEYPAPPPPEITTTTITNTTIVDENSASNAALAGAMGMHYFSRSTKNWQGSLSGACHNLSEHCALSGALAKRQDDFLWAVSISGNDNDKMIGGSFGWTFDGNE